jgi:glycine reductase
MKLELASFPVKDVKFAQQTRYNNGILEINKKDLINLILEDKKVKTADLEVVFPGEQTRIVKVRDAIEPRVKVSGTGCVFPGILGPVETVGEGRTHTLPGVVVMPSAEYNPTVLSGTEAGQRGVVDMWGPGGELTPFSKTINIVPLFTLVDNVTELEAHMAIQSAEFKIGRFLAETTRDLTPQNVEVFEFSKCDPSLPKVVYVLTALTEWHQSHSLVAYYGLPIRESLPTFIHPNELFDGAITMDARRAGGGINTVTWSWMNQPIALELLRKHGKELNFLGVILQRTRFETEFGKQVSAKCASQMARLLGADGAVITRIVTSGNNFMDVMFTVQALEQKGIKTVFSTPEWGGKDGSELPLVYYVPEATSMVSTGSFERDVELPKPAKVIGEGDTSLVNVYAGDKPFSPYEEVTLPSSFLIAGGVDWFGHLNLTCEED